MTTTTDWAHTPQAERRRTEKARALAEAARAQGLHPFEVHPTSDAEHERARRAALLLSADVATASAETWTQAVVELQRMAAAAAGAAVALCSACSHPVRWVVTEGGHRVAVDPFPHPLGTVWPHHLGAGGQPVARILTGSTEDRPADDVPLFRQHARSCPGQSGPAAPPALRCQECGHPLDRALAERDPSYRSHPTCDPRGDDPR